jgi:hypothetical protein
MVFENLEVKHKAFGAGVITEKQGKYITVKFASMQKVFVYPDIFEKFLTLADGGISDEIAADIASTNKQKQQIIDKKNEENFRAMTKGIVIPGKDINAEAEEEENRLKNSHEPEEI